MAWPMQGRRSARRPKASLPIPQAQCLAHPNTKSGKETFSDRRRPSGVCWPLSRRVCPARRPTITRRKNNQRKRMKDRNRHARPAPAPATKSIQIQISDRAEEQLTMLANHRQISREALVSEIVLSEAARLREIEKAAAAGHPHESELEEVTTYQGDGDTQHAIFKRKGR